MMFRTLKDILESNGVDYEEGDWTSPSDTLIDLRQSTIEDVKELQTKEHSLHIQGQIDYMKWKFNLTDEDLK